MVDHGGALFFSCQLMLALSSREIGDASFFTSERTSKGSLVGHPQRAGSVQNYHIIPILNGSALLASALKPETLGRDVHQLHEK